MVVKAVDLALEMVEESLLQIVASSHLMMKKTMILKNTVALAETL